MRHGVIIAGGRSTRFGERDKAVARLAGTPMIRRVADGIAPSVDTLLINCREDQRSAIESACAEYPLPTDFVIDETPDRGPLAGIHRALVTLPPEDYAFVVACDMPFVDAAITEVLFERAVGADAAVPRLDGWYQPLHAVYRAGATARAAEKAMEAGDDRPVHAIERLDARIVGEERLRRTGSLESFENVNTQQEARAAAARLNAES